jgi:aspartyl-tRNA(Asn)/glutamyl-tRNA(Gln) amidotransferase subunit A
MAKNDILGKSVVELLDLLEKKKISSAELFQYFLRRIKKYNPKLNAFITILNDVQLINQLDRKVPVAVKDNFCTKGVRTTASSKVLDNFIPPYESTVTRRLWENNFFLLGKTNMDAWAHGSSTETSDYGPTKNPWDLTRTPGGSSGGSAAAVAAYLAPVAVGSETAGSIRQPAAWCGVIGLKPTYGRVSRYGLIAMGSSLDCPGPLTRTVEDAALLLSVLAGKDPYDATTAEVDVPNYWESLKERKKMKIGVAEEYFDGVETEIKKGVFRCIDILKRMGHKIKKVKLLHPKYAISVYTIVQRAEVSSNLARYDGIRYGNNRHYFGEEAKRRIMLGTYTLSHGYYDAFYKKAQKVRQLIIEDFNRVFKDVGVIVSPTTPITALKLGEWEKYPFFGELMDVLNEPAAVAGLPAISLPVGLDSKKLPIGMQIIGRHFDEEGILNLAYQLEKETDFFGVTKTCLKKYKD